MKRRILGWVRDLQLYVSFWWYGPLASFLAGLDNLILVVPIDGVLASSSMLKPKRWFYFASMITIGSCIGGVVLAEIVIQLGPPIIDSLYPNLQGSEWWVLTDRFFDDYGLWVLFAVAATPVPQQPAVILSALAGFSAFKIGIILFIGRFIKYLIIAYVASHFPRLIGRLWGLKGELKEVGLPPKA